MKATAPRSSWRMPLRAQMIIALVSALIVAAKFYLNLPIHVPGHSGIFWMALIVIGVGIVRRPGAGTLIGLVSGILATLFVPGRQGIFVGVKYLSAGFTVDVLTQLLGGRLDRYLVAILVAAAGNVAKLASAYLIGALAGVPGGFLALGLGLASSTHLAFGALGGWIGAVVLKRLRRAGIPEPLSVSVADEAVTS